MFLRFVLRLSGLLLKVLFTHSAYRAYPVVGNIFECCAGSDSSGGISYFRIIDPVADGASILFHNFVFVYIYCDTLKIVFCLNNGVGVIKVHGRPIIYRGGRGMIG